MSNSEPGGEGLESVDSAEASSVPETSPQPPDLSAAKEGKKRGRPPGGDKSLPLPPVEEGEKCLRCVALKGKKIIVGKGDPVQVDDNGFLIVSEAEAARLLTIPGYKET